MKITIKEVLTSDNWIVTKILQGYNGRIRIDARRRFHKADEQNHYSEWTTDLYYKQLTGKKPNDHRNYTY